MTVDTMESIDELTALIEQAQLRIIELQTQTANTEAELHTQVQGAIQTLADVRGPDNAVRPTTENLLAGRVSVTELLTFSRAEMQQDSGIAIELILKGLKIMLETEIALARVQTRTLT